MMPPAADAPLEVLLVEDNPGDALLARRALERGWRGTCAIAGARSLGEARDLLGKREPGCVLLDLSLPDAEGLSALEAVLLARPETAVVVLSGLADEDVALQAVQHGAQDYLVKGALEPDGLARAIRYAVERKRAETQLTHLALHDALTELPNRRLLLDRLEIALARTGASRECAVLFCGLDRFKLVNDTLGHSGGDRVLVEVARRLTDQLRPGDTLARIGGDEFVAVCEEVDLQAAAEIARRLQGAIDRPYDIDGSELFVRASIGIAAGSGDDTPEDLLLDADRALREAKGHGPGAVVVAGAHPDETAVGLARAEAELRRAIEREDLVLHFQPVVELASGRIVGAEALVRWPHPERGLIPPLDFIPLAEETGLIVDLGAWVIRTACARAAQWTADHPDLVVSANLSVRQLQDPSLLSTVAAALDDSGVDPASICLEITESIGVEDAEDHRAVVSALRSLGVKLGLDDFGTGYASLSFLKRFPLDVLKIDRSFVWGLEESPEDAAILTAVLGLARARGLVAVAEGVETEVQRRVLTGLGCQRAQGFLFSKPIPADALTDLLLGPPVRVR